MKPEIKQEVLVALEIIIVLLLVLAILVVIEQELCDPRMDSTKV